MAISQQPATVNVQINNNVTNNYYSGAPDQGHQRRSPNGPNQGSQPTAPASRTPENRLTGAESVPNVPSASKPTHTTDPRGQNSSIENSSKSHPATTQTRPTQDIHRVESTPIPTRPATSQVPSWHQQQAKQKPLPTNVPATHVQKQNHGEKPQPEGNKHGWDFLKLPFSHSNHGNGPQRNSNFPNSATRLNPSGNRGGHANRNRASSAGRGVQRQHNAEAPWHQNQALHHQTQAPHHQTQTPPHQRVTSLPHGEVQPKRLDGGVGAPQRQPAVNQGAGATPEVAKELKKEDIKRREYNSPKEPEV